MSQLQRYAELVDEDSLLTTLQFHSRGCYAIQPGMNHSTYLSPIDDTKLLELTKRDLEFVPGARRISLPRADDDSPQARRESGINFDDNLPLNFSDLSKAIANGLCATKLPDGQLRMPYPSGGALYSIQCVVCCLSASVIEWPSDQNALHLLPFSRSLEPLIAIDSRPTLLSILSGADLARIGRPMAAVVYLMSIEKAIFKYRTRGYRIALCECGSMYQSLAEQAHLAGLSSRVWAGFNDHHVARALGLNPTHLLPIVVQFLGRV